MNSPTRRSVLAIGGALVTKILFHNTPAFAASRKTGSAIILFHAGGGWDSANGLDARLKGGEDEMAVRVRAFGEEAGRQRIILAEGPFNYRVDQPGVKAFLEAHGGNLTVCIVKMDSNDHGAGTDNMATGTMGMEDPAIGALFAASYANDALPTPFIVAGGSVKTGSLVPVANLGSVRELRAVLSPNQYNNDAGALYYPSEVASLIDAFRRGRLEARLAGAKLPAHMKSLQQLLLVSKGKEELTKIAKSLSQEYPEGIDPVTEVLLDLIELGMVRAISLSQGGFDTHGDDQNNLPERMANYFNQVSNLWKRAKERSLSSHLFIVGGSEFSRTPNLNGGGGTDHWPGTNTVFLLGANVRSQVIGKSDSAWYASPLDRTTLKPKRESDGGVVPTIGDFHNALRVYAKIKPELASRFPIPGSGLDHEALAKAFLR